MNWWAGARLCLDADGPGDAPREVARGALVEVIASAIAMPDAIQSRLFIRCEDVARHLRWPTITDLSRRIDFPVLI